MSSVYTIYNIKDEDFIEIIKNSTTWTEILRRCGYNSLGTNITVTKRCQKLNIDISHFALAEKNGTGTINIGKNAESLSGMGSSSLMEPTKHMKYFPEISFARKQEVQLITLVDFAKSFGISFVDLLWLDLQGKELDVLNGSSEFLRENVLLLHLELSRVQFYDGMPTIRDVRKFLRKSGFVILIDRVGAISGNSLYINARFKTR